MTNVIIVTKMVRSEEERNIVIGHIEDSIRELEDKIAKIKSQKDDFILSEGGKTGRPQTDLTKLTDRELQTKKVTLSKLRAQVVNADSNTVSEMQKTDREILRRRRR